MLLNESDFKRINIFQILLFLFLLGVSTKGHTQTAYFIDGYHGGIYGHYPSWFSRFMADQLKENPLWKINLEIEPETWDTALVNDPSALKELQGLCKDQSEKGRIEFVNPAYGQSYMFNISGESIIRHFSYGIKKIRQYFPQAVFSTYSSEEPCFTSALPQILRSFGYQYASLKNPNTCWGGYTRAFGGEIINWIGPDGSGLRTVPRYASEGFVLNSTWQTAGWTNSPAYIRDAFQHGIQHPVAMTLQDAGWKYGPWMKTMNNKGYEPTVYTTWRNYFENTSAKTMAKDWKFSQEDVLVSLVWGSQILQKLAQEVRVSENKIIMAEKMATISAIFQQGGWPQKALDDAWRCLMLSQHHDCWIVPYNGNPGKTWADKVKIWTDTSNSISDRLIYPINGSDLLKQTDKPIPIKVFNTTGSARMDYVKLDIGSDRSQKDWVILNGSGEKILSQIIAASPAGGRQIIFKARVPAVGFSVYQLVSGKEPSHRGAYVSVLDEGNILLETDWYRIVLDRSRGGSFKSFILKKQNNRELIDEKNVSRFNALRGNFYNDSGMQTSAANPANIKIIENGPLMIKVEIAGSIAAQPFVQTISLNNGEPRIDCQLQINWHQNRGIGSDYHQKGGLETKDMQKPFYNDSLKLLAVFPVNFASGKIYKDAPFDVTESKLSHTFFSSWDSIKNNILLNWVDLYDSVHQSGLALLLDHTSTYTYGQDFPLGLNMQYSGAGLWGRNHTITGPSSIKYAIIPHFGKWDEAGISSASVKWNEPLIAVCSPETGEAEKSLVDVSGTGFQVTSTYMDNGNLMIRVFNAEGDARVRKIFLGIRSDKMQIVELNGKIRDRLKVLQEKNRSYIEISIPRFGIRTIRVEKPVKM